MWKDLWGREIWVAHTDKYAFKIIEIKQGTRSSLHCAHGAARLASGPFIVSYTQLVTFSFAVGVLLVLDVRL